MPAQQQTIALAQYEVTQGQPDLNVEQILGFLKAAKAAGASVLVLPEMCTTGFHWEQNRLLLNDAHKVIDHLCQAARKYQTALTGSFLEKTERGNAANTQYFIDSTGQIVAKYRKVHLFTLFNEQSHVESGSEITTVDTTIGRCGLSVCYDLRFPELFRKCALAGAEIQILPAAFPHPRLEHWQTLNRARAIENQCYFIAVNQCGVETHQGDDQDTHYFGHSMVVDPWGQVLLEAGEDSGLFTLEIDLSDVSKVRNHLTALRDRRPDLY